LICRKLYKTEIQPPTLGNEAEHVSLNILSLQAKICLRPVSFLAERKAHHTLSCITLSEMTDTHSKTDHNILQILREGGILLSGASLAACTNSRRKAAGHKPGEHRCDGCGNTKAEAMEAVWNALQAAAAWRRHWFEQLMREENTLLLEVGLVFIGRGQLVLADVERPQQRATFEVLDAAFQFVVVQHELLQRRAALERLEAAGQVIRCKEQLLEPRAASERLEAAREVVGG